LSKCVQNIVEEAKKVRRLGGNDNIASVPLKLDLSIAVSPKLSKNNLKAL